MFTFLILPQSNKLETPSLPEETAEELAQVSICFAFIVISDKTFPDKIVKNRNVGKVS
jgi:hypothetical protein